MPALNDKHIHTRHAGGLYQRYEAYQKRGRTRPADDFRNAGIYRNAERVPKNAFRPRTGDLHRIVSFANQNQTEYRLLVQEKILYHYAIENIRRGRAHDPR